MDLEVAKWLLSDQAAPLLADVAGELDDGRIPPSAALVERLRRNLSPEKTHAIVGQVELRYRARLKFSQSQSMFFTPVLLEQATSERIASYKARSLIDGISGGGGIEGDRARVADLCCGMGGDALGFAHLADAGNNSAVSLTCVDRDPVAVEFAARNLAVVCTEFAERSHSSVGDACATNLTAFEAWHIDPDRRSSGGKRSTRVEAHSPGLQELSTMLDANPHALIKLAPATELSSDNEELGRFAECGREWVGERRECKQQLIRFGQLQVAPSGHHTATVVLAGGNVSFSADPNENADYTREVGDYLFEPHATVRAAGLVDALCRHSDLSRIGLSTSYATGSKSGSKDGSKDESQDPSTAKEELALFSAYKVLDALPFDRKRVKQRVAGLGLGRIQFKSRGSRLDPVIESRKLAAGTDGPPGVVFAFPVGNKTIAVIAERQPNEGSV